MIKNYLLSSKLLTGLVVFFTVLQSFLNAGLALIFAKFIDSASILDQANAGYRMFITYSILFFVYILLLTGADYLRRRFRASFFVSVDQAIKMDYFDKLLELEISEYSKRDTGHYLSRINNDIPVIIREYVMEFFNLLLYFFNVVFIIGVSFYINWILASVFLLLSVAIIIFTSSFEKRFSDIRREKSFYDGLYTTELKSSLAGFREIKVNNADDYFKKSLRQRIKEVNVRTFKWWMLEAIYSPGTGFLTLLLTFVSIIIASILYMNGSLSVGMLTASVFISTRIFNPISDFFEQITLMKANIDISQLVFSEVDSRHNKKDRHLKLENIHDINMKKISFKYENDSKYIIKDLNLNLERGKKYLVIGNSGVGKSTLLKILMGFIEFDGQLLINKCDLNQYNKHSYYSRIAYVSQSPYVFNRTIRENVDLLNSYSDCQVIEALMQVKLNHFTTKLDKLITEDVLQVSGGEKQRLALARALIKKPDILLLDEITSALDKDTTVEIEDLIVGIGVTTVYVCHKTSQGLVDSFDYVIEMKDNAIIVKGVKEDVTSVV